MAHRYLIKIGLTALIPPHPPLNPQMSNRSRNSEFKQSLSNITNDSEKIARLDRLNRKVISDQPIFRSREAYEILIDKKIPIYSPIAISQPTEVPFSEVFPSMTNMFSKTEGTGQETEVLISKSPLVGGWRRITPESILVYIPSNQKYLPSYRPNYFTSPPDTQLYSQLFHHYTTALGLMPDGSVTAKLEGYSVDSEAEIIFGDRDSLKYYGENYAFTSGTLRGQVERLRENFKVNQGEETFHKVKTLREQKLTFDDVGKILERFLPLPPFDPSEDGDLPLSGNYSNYISVLDYNGKKFLFNYSPKFQPETKAGMPYRQVAKKKDVRWDTVAMANTFLYNLTEALETNDVKEITTLMKNWWFLSVGYLFPKAERYKLIDKEHIKSVYSQLGKSFKKSTVKETRYEAEKTRNIWSMPFVTHFLASQNKVRLDDYSPRNIDNSDTPSLYKWSPWLGGMDRLLTKMQNWMLSFEKSAKKFSSWSLVYADNWYLLEGNKTGEKVNYRWLSLDQTKGEANATRSHLAAFENYLLNTCYTKENKDGSVLFYYNSTWGYFYRNLLPAMAVNMTGLFGNMLVKIPGQGSGNTDTFYVNHTMTAICVNYYEKEKLNQSEMTLDVLKNISKHTGVDWKIELDERGFGEKIETVRKTPCSFNTLVSPVVLKLDILGYDAVYSSQMNKFLPVSARDRMFKAAMLPKNFKSENKIVKAMYNNIRYNSLLLIGAWAYPTLRLALEGLVRDNYNVLLKISGTSEPLYAKEASRQAEQPVDLLELTDPDIVKYISGAAEPVNAEVLVKLNTGEPVEPPEKGKYVRIRSDLTSKQTIMLAPGFNLMSPMMKSHSSSKPEKWGDEDIDEELFIFRTPHTTEGLAKLTDRDKRLVREIFYKPGIRTINLTPKRKQMVLHFVMSNDAELVSTNNSLYTQVSFDTIWAKFKQLISGDNLSNPAHAGIYFDNQTGSIVRDPYNKLHKGGPDPQLKDLTKTQKKNTKRRFGTAEEMKTVILLSDEEQSLARIGGLKEEMTRLEGLIDNFDPPLSAYEDYLEICIELRKLDKEFVGIYEDLAADKIITERMDTQKYEDFE